MSNPPYVPEAEVAALPSKYQHEPAIRLARGADGFATPRPRLPLISLRVRRGRDGVLTTQAAELGEFLRLR